MWDENDALKALLEGFNNSSKDTATREANLQELFEELENENIKLLNKLSEERKEFHKLQRELDNRQQNSPREDIANLDNALQSKIDSLVEILDSIDNNDLSDAKIRQHPCMVTMHKAMQVLGDITGLVKTIGNAREGSSAKCSTLHEESHEEELEEMVIILSEQQQESIGRK